MHVRQSKSFVQYE
uniref:Uncharacterized protein n=1 Tax=Lepeophtheirus salmonis TaxID=72036 RepID=A0A0K2UPV0_LEPSM